MACEPTPSDEVVRVVHPSVFSVPVPRTAAPSLKVTVPVGVPAPGPALTVAVNVTGCPKSAGFSDDATAVVDGPAVIVCVSTLEVLPPILPSPPYTAVIECGPDAREEVLSVVHPPGFSDPVPSTVLPSLKVTDPVGRPEPTLTRSEEH